MLKSLTIMLLLTSCSSFKPKQDITLLIDPSDVNYKCFKTDRDTITCRRQDPRD